MAKLVDCKCCGEEIEEEDSSICDECGLAELCEECAPHDFHKEVVVPT